MYSNLMPYIPDMKPPEGAILNPHLEINKGLVGLWPFWAGAGNKVSDLSGNEYTGTEQVDSVWQPGKFGTSRYFSDNDYILNSTSNWRSQDYSGTIAAWIKLEDINRLSTIFATSDEAGSINYLYFLVADDNKLRVQNRGGGALDQIIGSTIFVAGRWYFVVLTSDGTAYKLFVDGKEETISVEVGSNTGDWFGDISDRDNFTIGVWKYSSLARYFKGWIDNILIWNRNCSAPEIALLCRESFCGFRWTSVIQLASYIAAVGGIPIFRRRRAG